MTNTNKSLNLEDLTVVNGGTFTANMFPEWAYQRAGFRTDFHFLARDEFIMNGNTYHEDDANAIMAKLGWEIRMVQVSSRRTRNLGASFVDERPIYKKVIFHNGVEQHENMI